jgi:hypothetical protein
MTRKRRTKERQVIDGTMKYFVGIGMRTLFFDPLIIATHATPQEIRALRAEIKVIQKWLDKVVALRSRGGA